MKSLLIVLIALAVVSAGNWAVIVAGSDGFYNYRHQADACHAYHIHKDNGIPADHIILFSKGDVAPHKSNPFPNQLYNRPGNESINYQEGCVYDYSGDNVTPAIYLALLQGDVETVKKLSGLKNPKMLNSTSDDNVFLSFFDHGAPGIIAFPSGSVTARELNNALVKMHQNKMYKKLVYYMEACESGSMFDKLLPDNLNIYVTTAANPTESSWGYYCGNDAIVKGVNVGTCLGDLYSIVWMEEADRAQKTETLAKNWDVILTGVTLSHPQQYGDMSWLSDNWFSFIGSAKSPRQHTTHLHSTAWNSRDIPMKSMEYLSVYGHSAEVREGAKKDLEAELAHRTVVDKRFVEMVHYLYEPEENRYEILNKRSTPLTKEIEDCYYTAVEAYKAHCGMTEYSMRYFQTLVNICSTGKKTEEVVKSIAYIC